MGAFEPSEASTAVCYWGSGSVVVVESLFIGGLCLILVLLFWCLAFLVLQWS